MSVFAAATGVGSWPGSVPREAAEIVVGELHRLPHLVELPARGVGADMIGRAGALLVDIAIDTVPRGYRITARPGAVTRRAKSLLDEDIDAIEEAWERAGGPGSGRPVKVQAPGPITLAAQLELPNGHRALTDAGAVRDLASSLAEGVGRHRAELARRLDTTVVVQYDEPVLSAALAGRLTGVTALNPVHPVDEAVAITLLDECVAGAGTEVLLHSCADVPWNVLQRSMINAVSLDAGALGDADLDGLGEFLDSGRAAIFGLLPTSAPAARPSAEEVAAAAVAITDRIGFSRSSVRDRIGVSPACGLAGATAAWARVAVGLCQRAADAVTEDPEAI
ncbi:methionine synthase II (cobalamin-independent) [Mycolicibacterium sp. BK634]|uniref:methionine synthase n=1 Tax=Mycobacteriaceae TaxID=1762 RepID=UPI00105DB615|nr:methionine synthase [Mycobacterium sp. BK086]MBB3754197.1 methionine synthase II (cobalamin-independent) [Mycolicibacterium sp. BK634]TDO17831.1 cobalamin-independent methionine synthase catalytic subunit [Mycobacterium sp. BK086]